MMVKKDRGSPPSAILLFSGVPLPTRFTGIPSLLALTVWASAANSAHGPLCEPSAEVLRELEEASSATGAESATVEQVIEPLRRLRGRLPDDLFVHLRYQDAIKERGVEGHLRQMLEEYLVLKIKHPGDPFHLYLFGRALEGRTTPRAISTMEEVLKLDPGFAPAHRTLAEIYGSAAFRDRKKENAQRSKFQEACPGSVIPIQPPPLPPPGDFSTAERLLGHDGSERVDELVNRALQQQAWRMHRIRPFDWYTAEQKKQAVLEAQSAQWRGWSLLVRHYRALHQDAKAQQLLSELQGRFQQIHGERSPDLFWTAATALVQLQAEEKRTEKVRETLTRMESFLTATPNRRRSAELAKFRLKFASRSSQPHRPPTP
jgi:hypothetical protein